MINNHSEEEQRSFDREAFRRAYMARLGNAENDERERHRLWMSSLSFSSNGSQSSSRPPLVNNNLNNNSITASIPVVNQHHTVANEGSNRNISSIEISSPAKRRLWLLGQRYSSSSSSIGDAHSVAASSSFSTGTRSFAGPVSPPSLRSKRIGKVDNYNPLQMMLHHASQHDNELSSVDNDPSSIHEDCNAPVQGGHLLQLLNQLARSNGAQTSHHSPSPPSHLDVTLNSSDDDDGSSLLSNVSSFFSPLRVYCSQSENNAIGAHDCQQQQQLMDEDDKRDEFEYSKFDSAALQDEEWSILSSIALSILAVVSVLIVLSGIFSIQAKLNIWKASLSIRLWEGVHGYQSLRKLFVQRNSVAFAILRDWFLEMMKRCETLYLGTLDDLLQLRNRYFLSLSLNKVTTLLMQEMRRLKDYTTTSLGNIDVSLMTLEQLYRATNAYYSTIEVFKNAQTSIIGLQTSTALAWNTTLIWQQVRVTMYECKEWLVTPISYKAQEYLSIQKSSLTVTEPIIFDININDFKNENLLDFKNDTIRCEEEDDQIEQMIEDNFPIMSPTFWKQQPRAFVRRTLPAVELSLVAQRNTSRVENEEVPLDTSDNLNALVVQRMRNSKQPAKKNEKKKMKVRDYYDSLVPRDQKDVFDGVDAMSIVSDAIVRWWYQVKE